MSVSFKVYQSIAVCLGLIFVLKFLAAMLARETVKQDLCERGCQPIHIHWTPYVFWTPRRWSTSFRVTYQDSAGSRHRASCYVYTPLMGSPFGPRRVTWLKDETG